MNTDRIALVAPCGIDCGICELHTCKDDPKLFSYLLSRGIPKEKIPCGGCREIRGNCPVLPAQCSTFLCIEEKQKKFCHECGDFPCGMLQPCADRAEILPHNMKVFNLSVIRRAGVEGFIRESAEIKHKYYRGKMAIGQGPQIQEK